MSTQVTTGSVVATAGENISLGGLVAVSAGNDPQYLVVSGLDRDEYTAASNNQMGTISGNGQSTTFAYIGGDSYTFGIVYTYNAITGTYANATLGTLSNTILAASSDIDRNEVLSFFTTNDASLATADATNPYALSQSSAAYVGSVDVVTQASRAASPANQATPDSICSVAQTFVGQAWNESGCWVLCCNISSEAGASLPISSPSVDVAGLANGEWFVAYDGPAGQTGDWQSMVRAGDMVDFQTSATSGHITTVVSGAGATAQLVDNITYVNANGTVANASSDGNADDVTIASAHAASQEFAQAVAGSVVIYRLDTPIVTASGAATVTAGAATSIAGFFTAADPNGKAVTTYQIYDTTTQNSLIVNGTTYSAHSAASAVTVSSAALATVQLSSALTTASDTLEVRAFNGSYWGDWQAITVNSVAPVTTVQSAIQMLAQGQVTAANITDTSANVMANLGSLGSLSAAGKIAAIALTDAGVPTLALSASQMAGAASALAKITSSFALSSSGAAIAANINALQVVANAGHLTSINLTDASIPTLTLSAAQLTSDNQVLAKISGHFALSTASAGVNANLGSLSAMATAGQLTSVLLTDGGIPTLTLSAAQFNAATALLGKIASPYALSVVAGSAALTLTGQAAINYLSAGNAGGAHLIRAGASSAGTDMIYGGLGADTLVGSTSTSGHADLIAGSGQNILYGGSGYDTLYGGGNTVLDAGASNQKLLAGFASGSSDTLNAGSGSYEFLATVHGNNVLNAGSGVGDFLIGGSGADFLNGSTAATGSAILVAGSGANVLNGGLGADTLVGGGASVLTAGAGNHQILVGGFSANAHDTLSAGTSNAVIGVLEGNNLLLAGRGNASLYGGSGSDTLQGGGGNGVLVAGTGAQLLEAGSGSDTLVGGGASLLVGGSGANGTSVLLGGFSLTAHDTLQGGTGNGETLAVVEGNNQLFADSTGAATDQLWAGTGHDTLYGAAYGHNVSGLIATTNYVVGAGNATVLGGGGNDDVTVQNGTGHTVVDGGGGSNDVTFSGHAYSDATIATNASGTTTVAFADSTQTATLTNVQGLLFEGSSAIHNIA